MRALGESFCPVSLRTVISTSFLSRMGNLISQELLEVQSGAVGFGVGLFLHQSQFLRDRARPLLSSSSAWKRHCSLLTFAQPFVELSNQLIAHKTEQNYFSICNTIRIDQRVMESQLYLFLHCKIESALHLFSVFSPV